MVKTMVKAGIVGGTGYTGVELLRLLAQHPNVELKAIKADVQLRNAAQLRLNVPSNKLHHALLKELLLKYGKDEKLTVY